MPKSIKDFKKEAKKPKLRDGEYLAKVTFCDYAENYLNNSAIEVRYTLEDKAGNTFDFKEVFKNNLNAPRTYSFFCHLEDIDIDRDNFTDFVGVREYVTLKRNFAEGYNKALLAIDPESRRFVDKEEVES